MAPTTTAAIGTMTAYMRAGLHSNTVEHVCSSTSAVKGSVKSVKPTVELQRICIWRNKDEQQLVIHYYPLKLEHFIYI